jgi:hypothetical protein
MSDISPFIVESLRGLFAGVSPAFWVLDAGCVWLVKLRMLLFALAFLSSVFALFTAPIGRPVGSNFLFFDASSASSVLCDAPGGRLLSACESLEDSVKNCEMVATGKSLESVSLTALAILRLNIILLDLFAKLLRKDY